MAAGEPTAVVPGGLYDRALLVVTADHGISFRAGQKRRPLSPENLQDIA